MFQQLTRRLRNEWRYSRLERFRSSRAIDIWSQAGVLSDQIRGTGKTVTMATIGCGVVRYQEEIVFIAETNDAVETCLDKIISFTATNGVSTDGCGTTKPRFGLELHLRESLWSRPPPQTERSTRRTQDTSTNNAWPATNGSSRLLRREFALQGVG
jgi:hypothetical protein